MKQWCSDVHFVPGTLMKRAMTILFAFFASLTPHGAHYACQTIPAFVV